MRRCRWPACHYPARRLEFCWSHFQALGEDLQVRLSLAQGTVDWAPALEACDEHARSTIDWVKKHVTGGSTC